MPAANVYIDGFNLYYGCLRRTPYRWLDVSAFARKLLPTSFSLGTIRYYTARVGGFPGNAQAPRRQETYLRALGTLPRVSIVFGHFLSSVVMMPLAEPAPNGPRFARVVRTEEKGSDVNLASHLLVDAFSRDCDVAFLITNDSDLLEPIRIARRRFGVTVGLASPYKRPARVLAAEVDFLRPIWASTLQRCQFPVALVDAKGAFSKPLGW